MAHTHPLVLIVEDNDEVREVLAYCIAGEGYAVETARDGTEALAKMHDTIPCIIILDLEMPGMTGMGFRTAQIARAELSAIPVLVCSAAGDIREVSERIGAVAFAPKPVAPADLMRLIRAHCLK